MMSNPVRLALLAAALPLSGCALLQPPRVINDVYILKAEPMADAVARMPLSITVIEPEAAPGLDSARIAVLESSQRLNYYNQVAWAKPLPQMVQTFFNDALQQSHGFTAVSTDKDGVFSDVNLLTDIRDFEVDSSGAAPAVHVRLVSKLVNANNHKIIATFPLDKTVTASANHMPEIVAAFNDAMNQLAAEALHDVAEACARPHSCTAPSPSVRGPG
jgi:cholesterol transport system auxiliary component